MKFLDAIFTQEGAGVVVARTVDGEVLVALNAREVEVVPSPSAAPSAAQTNGKTVVKTYPGRCVMMRHCQAHGVWFESECLLCNHRDTESTEVEL